jgi:Septum formation
MSATAGTRCAALFQTYVGTDPDRSRLFLSWFEPSNRLWDQGDRSVTCFTYLRDGTELTQSVRGSGL